MTPQSILKQYWGYDSFRPKQLDIIERVLDGQDTIALLTTGGGKSICFQVPAILMEGVAIVISPLIALMKDQVEGLRARGISADAIYSGRSFRDIDRILDNAVFGHLKLLYLSPERLLTDIVIARIKAMTVSMIAIDEAHCISQWGYDFRPSYMRIAELREWHPTRPFIALTATATTRVITDISEKLELNDFEIIDTSFAREGLSIRMKSVDTKQTALVNLLKETRETAIVYVYSRKDAKSYSDHLNLHGIQADFYHAGLSQKEREQKQTAWMTNKTLIMVCTNAFGMGIDKADVRQVVHLHLPNSIEAYYQEIGRAGRDGKASTATTLYSETDKDLLIQRIERSFPPIATIRRIYEALGGYFSLAVGGGQFESFDFDIMDFSKKMQFDLLDVHHALRILEREEYLTLSEQRWQSSSVWIKQTSRMINDYIEANYSNGIVINALLRMYQSVGQQPTFINEGAVARHASIDHKKVVAQLKYLHSEDIIEYKQRKELPQVSYITDRISARNLLLDHEYYRMLKARKLQAATAMISLVEHPRCRQQNILKYFGEEGIRCGICDRCVETDGQRNLSKALIDKIHDLPTGQDVPLELLTSATLTTYLMDENLITRKGKSYIRK